MARETSDDDQHDVAALRRQVQELRTSLKEMTSRYDRLSALFSSSLVESTIALNKSSQQPNTATTSIHENQEERSMAEMEISTPKPQQKIASAIASTPSPDLTTTTMNVTEHPARQLQQPTTHTPITTTTTTQQAAQPAKSTPPRLKFTNL
ncbi:uncharacterized protein LOC119647232 [Hermetia illucens]|uniref:uncharacterized protein LOC119647232 n=1 Tax=Hermetia illucens TaxID=343691 RepID=UPI0018CC3A29|nr:uncharacterized protein LOC119647232 [Hermetia illucens]